jgi:hypothetical protein
MPLVYMELPIFVRSLGKREFWTGLKDILTGDEGYRNSYCRSVFCAR